MAQGDDEVTVGVGDEVAVLDDSKSEEWWMVRRLKNGKEGVVPSSYVEVTGFISSPPAATPIESGLSAVERNRLEEARLAKEATQKSIAEQDAPRSPRVWTLSNESQAKLTLYIAPPQEGQQEQPEVQ
jgi:hypothetical protein